MIRLKDLLNEDEMLVKFTTTKTPIFNSGWVTYTMIVPKDTDIDKLDPHSCLEETLYRLIGNEATDQEIEYILYARIDSPDEPWNIEEDTYIDLGYYIPGELTHVYIGG